MSETSHEGTATVLYLERDTPVGSRRSYCCGYRSPSGVPSSAFWPHTAYFCPHCGEIWARAIYTFDFAYAPIPRDSWVVEKRPCVEHGDGQLLFGQWDLDGCSPELLTRELLALMENYK